MKKFLVALVLLCFGLNSLAATGTVAELNRSINEFQYAVTVEWDQRDQAFYDAQSRALVARLATLRAQGLTQNDVQSVLESRVSNPATLERLRTQLALMGNAQNDEELVRMISQAKNFGQQGASWSADGALIMGGIAVAVLAIALYAMSWNSNHECVEWQEEYDCQCTQSSGGEDSTCEAEACGIFNNCVRMGEKQ